MTRMCRARWPGPHSRSLTTPTASASAPRSATARSTSAWPSRRMATIRPCCRALRRTSACGDASTATAIPWTSPIRPRRTRSGSGFPSRSGRCPVHLATASTAASSAASAPSPTRRAARMTCWRCTGTRRTRNSTSWTRWTTTRPRWNSRPAPSSAASGATPPVPSPWATTTGRPPRIPTRGKMSNSSARGSPILAVS